MTIHFRGNSGEQTEEQIAAVQALSSDDTTTRNGTDIWIESNATQQQIDAVCATFDLTRVL